jgi:Papain family cysteine protease
MEKKMTIVNHFKPRKLILKESTKQDFVDLQIGEATIDPSLTLPPFPPSFSIRNEMTAVEDQGAGETCTSFCVVACLEHIHQRDLSEGQVTDEAERTYGDCTAGLALIHAYELCKSPGAVDEALWAYDGNQICWVSPPNVAGAARFRFNEIGYVYQRERSFTLNALKTQQLQSAAPGLPLSVAIQRQLFARRRPVSASVPVVWDAWPWTGEVIMPPPSLLEEFLETMSPPNTAGWHCIAICGWDNSTGRFLFKNSWGNFWGDKGYGTIPYQYIDLYSDVAMVGW